MSGGYIIDVSRESGELVPQTPAIGRELPPATDLILWYRFSVFLLLSGSICRRITRMHVLNLFVVVVGNAVEFRFIRENCILQFRPWGKEVSNARQIFSIHAPVIFHKSDRFVVKVHFVWNNVSYACSQEIFSVTNGSYLIREVM